MDWTNPAEIRRTWYHKELERHACGRRPSGPWSPAQTVDDFADYLGLDRRNGTISLWSWMCRRGSHWARKSLSVNVFENLPAGSCWTITCLEILPMELLQIFDIEAGAVLAEMRSAT
jgi:hypothetical protein